MRRQTRRTRRKQRGGAKKGIYTAVIVEPRQHKSMEFVLENALENLDDRWNILIFHGNLNEAWLKKMIEKRFAKYKSRIKMISLEVDNLEYPVGYNQLLMSPYFYNQIPTEMMLVFQTDSMICPEHKDLVYEFMDYDYVGAPCAHGPNGSIAVGNGGLSLRRKSKMLEVIEKCKPRKIDEDIFFGQPCPEVKLKKPSLEKASFFSIQDYEHHKAFGIHQGYRKFADTLEKQCKGAKKLYNIENGIGEFNIIHTKKRPPLVSENDCGGNRIKIEGKCI